jgi:hypothetical protein
MSCPCCWTSSTKTLLRALRPWEAAVLREWR